MTDAADLIMWQRRATDILADLLEQAERDNLPVLVWTVHNAGCSLVGRSLATPSPRRRGEIRAWADALGIELDPERHEHQWQSGGSNITVSADQRETRHGFCTIALVADIYADDDGS